MDKVTIIGAGMVGETTAQMVAEAELCRELVLIDIRQGVPQVVALDAMQTSSFFHFDTRVSGSNKPEGEYGQQGLAMGVPCVLPENRVERVLELDLNPPKSPFSRPLRKAVRADRINIPLVA